MFQVATQVRDSEGVRELEIDVSSPEEAYELLEKLDGHRCSEMLLLPLPLDTSRRSPKLTIWGGPKWFIISVTHDQQYYHVDSEDPPPDEIDLVGGGQAIILSPHEAATRRQAKEAIRHFMDGDPMAIPHLNAQ